MARCEARPSRKSPGFRRYSLRSSSIFVLAVRPVIFLTISSISDLVNLRAIKTLIVSKKQDARATRAEAVLKLLDLSGLLSESPQLFCIGKLFEKGHTHTP